MQHPNVAGLRNIIIASNIWDNGDGSFDKYWTQILHDLYWGAYGSAYGYEPTSIEKKAILRGKHD